MGKLSLLLCGLLAYALLRERRRRARELAELELRVRAVEAWGAQVVDPAMAQQVRAEGLLVSAIKTQDSLSRVIKLHQQQLELLLPTGPKKTPPN